MAKTQLVTHKDIVGLLAQQGRDATILTITAWGRRGLLGEPVIDGPQKHYRLSDVRRRLKAIPDGRTQLTDADVKAIRKRARRESGVALATEFGVSQAAISLIVNNKRRRND